VDCGSILSALFIFLLFFEVVVSAMAKMVGLSHCIWPICSVYSTRPMKPPKPYSTHPLRLSTCFSAYPRRRSCRNRRSTPLHAPPVHLRLILPVPLVSGTNFSHPLQPPPLHPPLDFSRRDLQFPPLLVLNDGFLIFDLQNCKKKSNASGYI
jgi:hypothetical protein